MIKFICDRCGKEWEFKAYPIIGCATKDDEQHLMISTTIGGTYRAIQLCDECEKEIYDQIFAYKYLNHKKEEKKTNENKEEHCYA